MEASVWEPPMHQWKDSVSFLSVMEASSELGPSAAAGRAAARAQHR